MSNFFFDSISNFMRISWESGDKNVFYHFYPNVSFKQKYVTRYIDGNYDNRKCANLFICRVRYGYNGAGFTGYGKSIEEAMTNVLEQVEVRLSQRNVNLAKKELDKKYKALFEEKLCIVRM